MEALYIREGLKDSNSRRRSMDWRGWAGGPMQRQNRVFLRPFLDLSGTFSRYFPENAEEHAKKGQKTQFQQRVLLSTDPTLHSTLYSPELTQHHQVLTQYHSEPTSRKHFPNNLLIGIYNREHFCPKIISFLWSRHFTTEL